MEELNRQNNNNELAKLFKQVVINQFNIDGKIYFTFYINYLNNNMLKIEDNRLINKKIIDIPVENVLSMKSLKSRFNDKIKFIMNFKGVRQMNIYTRNVKEIKKLKKFIESILKINENIYYRV